MKRTGLMMMGLAAGLLWTGCRREAEPDISSEATATSAPSATTRSQRIDYASLSNDQAIVTVDGKALTKGALERECAIRQALARLADPKLTVEKQEKIRQSVLDSAVRRFLLRQAVLSEAERRGVVESEEELAALHERFLQSLGRKQPRRTFAQVTNRLSAAEAQALMDDLRLDCRYGKMQAILRDEAATHITPEETERRFRDIGRYNQRARAEEQQIYAQATNVYERLKSGETFESLVDEFAGQAPRIDTDLEWGTFQRGFFADDPEIHRLLGEMKDGEYSPPVQGNNGIIIIRLNRTVAPDKADDPGGDYYQLGKIFFALPEIFELSDQAALRARIERELTDKKLNRKLLELQAACKVEHPNGVVAMPRNRK
ncbi:MAG: peptidylprolyl isomerase [Kiritimatiellia bacterium]